MADNNEAGGSRIGGEEDIRTVISQAVTKTLTSLFPAACEGVRVWIEGGKKGPPPVISFGSVNYSIDVATEDAPPTASPEVKKKKQRKRSKPAPKMTISGYEDMVSPRDDGMSRVHEAGRLILPQELLRLGEGCMFSLQDAILKLERKLLKEEDPNYPVFTVKVPKYLADFVHEAPADYFFISYEDVFKLFHYKRLDYNLVRLYALNQAMRIRRDNTPYVKVVDPYYMRDSLLVEGSTTRAMATEFLQRVMLNNQDKNGLLLPFFSK